MLANAWIRAGLVAGLATFFWALPAWAQPTPIEPQVGDTLRYQLSNGDTASTRVVRVRHDGKRTLATLEQVIEHGSEHRTQRLTLVRTEQGVALSLPEVEDLGGQKSPLVCYLAQANINDTWTAQRGSYRDSDGEMSEYKIFARLEAIETLNVKAGTFPGCYRIGYRTVMGTGEGADTVVMQIWFKPDIGIVKTRTIEGSQTVETELTAYSSQAPRP